MPQLNPNPWLLTFISSWTLIILMAPWKILTHTTPNNPTTKTSSLPDSSWIWLWQ
uniref:ATP synthase complex subunit 8 n=1 Tax=Ptychadena mascareniensis TaxID=88031 RepID=S4V0Q9_9NEOB|nr:ATP synthase F0 subunit 8 [Ptychadena mascareniensis]